MKFKNINNGKISDNRRWLLGVLCGRINANVVGVALM